SDNADDPAYTNLWIGENGGSGFQPWHEIQANGGGTFLENSGRQIDGAQSFAIFAGDQSGGTW
ncbi:MAG TPA: hypothetical protein VKK61_02765, partial [Tepidisphaeraceae bacterium]|nr:hypothetical protein [Tepidisphaeraceae bacterium]